jgi:PAS domain S-box-containing protein
MINTMKSLIKINSLALKLVLYFLLVGLVTVMAIGSFSYYESKSTIFMQAEDHLVSVRKIKKSQIENYFTERFDNTTDFAKRPLVADAMRTLEKAYTLGVKSSEYDSASKKYGPTLTQLKEYYGYYDLFLVSMNGDVVYTVAREPDFATNLLTGPYKNENVAEAFKSAREQITLVDFKKYAPSNMAPASFIAAPIENIAGEKLGVLILQLPLDQINIIMQERSGMGETGETYIVGDDYFMRTDSRFQKESTVLTREVRTDAVKNGLNGVSGTGVVADYRGIKVLSSFEKLSIGGMNWVILSEIDFDEIIKPVYKLRNILLVVAGVLSLIIAAVAYLISKSIVKPIVNVKNSLVKMGHGELIESVEERSPNEETTQMLSAINGLIKNLRNVSDVAKEIGNGNLETVFEPAGEKDVLGQSLLRMKDNLKAVAIEDKKREWSNQGLAKIGDILRTQFEKSGELFDAIVSFVVKYTNSNQGGIFLYNNEKKDDEHLELIACYAYERKKYVTKKLMTGEGLVGQCFKEQEMIYMTSLPKDYITITSGLGGSVPSCLVLLPLKINDNVVGVLEIASFNKFEKYELDLLQKFCEGIAATVTTVRINARTKYLLEQSQQQSEELRAQEEEMRQNMEELTATQEEMQRKELEMVGHLTAVNSSQAVIEFDPNGNILNANDLFLNTMKCSLSEIKGRHHRMFVETEYGDSTEYKNFWNDLRSGKTMSGEFKRVARDGSPVWLLASYTPVFNAQGSPTRIIKLARNITKDVKAKEVFEEQIVNLERREKELLDIMTELMGIHEKEISDSLKVRISSVLTS